MTIKFLHEPLERIDQLCKQAEQNGEKVMVSINTYKKERIGHYDKVDRFSDEQTYDEDEVDTITGGFSQQIRSSKDIFQFDNKDDNNSNKDEDDIS